MTKKFKLPPKKVLITAGIVLVLAGAAWGIPRAFFGNRVVGLDARPWRRPVAVKPVGVRVEPAEPARPAAVETTPVKGKPSAKLAIILDDWGMNAGLVENVAALKRPVTLAILPHLKYSARIADDASSRGLGIMLHMPMQAKSRNAAKEDDIITVDAPEVRIRRFLDEALASVPGVRGVNNHQGSAATSDPRVMRAVLSHLKSKNLFFIDSFVIASTAGPATAKEVGIPFAKRDVFIDNVVQIEPIKVQLRKAVQKALKNKTAIAIGHDKKATIEAIRQMIPEIEKAGVRLVLAEELVK